MDMLAVRPLATLCTRAPDASGVKPAKVEATMEAKAATTKTSTR